MFLKHSMTILFVLCTFTFFLDSLPANDSATSKIKALTYNIRYLNNRDGKDVWGNRRERVVEVIKDADVVGLQEVVKAQLDYIRENTPEFQWYGVGRDDGKEKGEMTPIGIRKSKLSFVSRDTFWLSPNPKEVGRAGWDAALPRIASWALIKLENGRQFYFVNTHFDHRGNLARIESGKLLGQWISEHSTNPAILLGDFNARLEDAPLKSLLEHSRLRDARAANNVDDRGPNTTWCGFKQLVDGRRIDHIFIAGDVEVTAYETLNPKTSKGRFASDHLPILSKLNLMPGKMK